MELKDAFIQLLDAEQELNRLENEKREADYEMAKFMAEARNKVAALENECARIMRENGVVEDVIEGRVSNFKLCFSKPSKTVDIADETAVPDEFAKVERKPMKREIAAAFKDAVQLPNWLAWKEGESKFQYRVLKK